MRSFLIHTLPLWAFFSKTNLFLRRRLVSSIVNEVGHRALHALGQNLLNLLGHNRVLAVVERVCLAGA
jgi:hypothetical protein